MRIVVLASLVAALTAGCGKNQEEAHKFPTANQGKTAARQISDLVSYQLDNGISVYLQEEHTNNNVAMEVLYRGGFIFEPAKQVQVSHLVEHLAVHSATASYAAEEALGRLHNKGRVNAETVADFVHFDYIVPNSMLNETLKIEAERLTSAHFEQDVLDRESKKAASEITKIVDDKRGPMTKFALMSMNQIINHDQTFVPIYQGNFERTLDQLKAFHDTYYRPDDMVIILVGGFSIDAVKPIIQKYFAGIPRRPTPPVPKATITGNVDAHWDVNVDAFMFVYPEMPDSFKSRVILDMFGSFLSAYISNNPSIFDLAVTTYATNPVYPVRDLPFFLYGQVTPDKSVDDLKSTMDGLMKDALNGIDERLVERMKTNTIQFLQSSLLASQPSTPAITQDRLTGQHALNIGIKHYFREGRSTDEMVKLIDSITYDEVKAVLTGYLSPDKRRTVILHRGSH